MGALKYWNGSAWTAAAGILSKHWDGSSWVQATTKVWDGNAWTTFVGLNRNNTSSVYQTYIPAEAVVTFNTDGTITGLDGSDTYVTPSGISGSNYEIYVTSTGSALNQNSGTSTWLNLGTARTWSVYADTGAGLYSATLTVLIRRVGQSSPSYSRTIVLSAQSDAPSYP